MPELLRVSVHGHTDVGSHGENVYHESDVTLLDQMNRPVLGNYTSSISDHDSEYGLHKFLELMRYKKMEYPFVAQIEISTPGHAIVSGPIETILGTMKEYKLKEMAAKNKEYLKAKNPDAVTSNILDFFDKFTGGNDKVVVGLPHMLDTLKSGVIGKYPAEEALKIVRSRHVNYLEAFNGMNSELGNYFNASLAILSKKLFGKHIMVGADYHTPKMMDTNLNLLEVPSPDETSILKAMKDGKVVGFENLVSANLNDTKRWAINRIIKSERDMIMKTYTDGWTKDSSFSSIANKRPFPSLIRAAIRYAVKEPDSKCWDALTKAASGVNRIYEKFQMTPKYKKFLKEVTNGSVGPYEPLDYDEFRKDPLRAFEQISIIPAGSPQKFLDIKN